MLFTLPALHLQACEHHPLLQLPHGRYRRGAERGTRLQRGALPQQSAAPGGARGRRLAGVMWQERAQKAGGKAG